MILQFLVVVVPSYVTHFLAVITYCTMLAIRPVSQPVYP
jgi:hypothetical protein